MVFSSLFASKDQKKNNAAPQPAKSANAAPSLFTLLDQATTAVYKKELHEPIKVAVMKKLGVGRWSMTMSNELTKFREGLKGEARDQASDDIMDEINRTQQNESNLTKGFYSLKANKAAYKESKTSVNAVMDKKAEDILYNTLQPLSTYNTLNSHGYSTLDMDKSDKDIIKDFTKSVTKKAVELKPEKQEAAVDKARQIVKGQTETDKKNRDSLTSEVKQKVKEDKVGANSLKYAMTEDSLNTAFSKISGIVKQIVPNEGDSAEIEFEINIPIASNAFIVIGLGAEVEHDEDNFFQVGANVNIGAGGKVGIAEIKGTIGAFVEAKGKGEKAALNLISYGLYRRVYAVSPSLAETIWGDGGKTGYSKFEEAEIWAAMMESKHLNDEDAYVSVGAQAGVDASVETGIFEGDFGVQGQIYKTYNKKAIEGIGKDSDGNVQAGKTAMTFGDNIDINYILNKNKKGTMGWVAGRQALEERAKRYSEITASKKISVSAEMELALGAYSLGVAGEVSAEFNNGLKSIEGELSLSLPDNIEGVDAFNQLVPKVSDLTTRVIGYNLYNKENDKETRAELEKAKQITMSSLQSAAAGLNLEDTAFEDVYGSDITGSFGFEFDFKKRKSEYSLALHKSSSHEVDAEIVKFSYSKSKLLAKKEFEHAWAALPATPNQNQGQSGGGANP